MTCVICNVSADVVSPVGGRSHLRRRALFQVLLPSDRSGAKLCQMLGPFLRAGSRRLFSLENEVVTQAYPLVK